MECQTPCRFAADNLLFALNNYVDDIDNAEEFYSFIHEYFNSDLFDSWTREACGYELLWLRFQTVKAVPYEEYRSRIKANVVVSITSFPARIEGVPMVLETIYSQTRVPDRVVLWLGEEQFPGKEADLPEELIPLKSYNGIEANMELFPAVIEKLTQKLMHSKPRRKVHLKKNGDSHGIDSKKIAAIIVFILLLIFGRDFWILRMNSPLPFSIMLFGYCAIVYCIFKFQAKSERAFSLRVLKLTDLDHNINEFVTLLMEKDNVGEWEITTDLIDSDDSECIWSAKRKGAVIRSFGNIHPDYLCFYFTEVNGYEGRLRPLNIDGFVSKNRAAALLLGQGFNLVWQKESTACYKNGEWRLFLCFYGIRKNILAMELIRGERESSFEQIVEEAKKRTLVGGVKGILRKKEG